MPHFVVNHPGPSCGCSQGADTQRETMISNILNAGMTQFTSEELNVLETPVLTKLEETFGSSRQVTANTSQFPTVNTLGFSTNSRHKDYLIANVINAANMIRFSPQDLVELSEDKLEELEAYFDSVIRRLPKRPTASQPQNITNYAAAIGNARGSMTNQEQALPTPDWGGSVTPQSDWLNGATPQNNFGEAPLPSPWN